MSANVVVRTEDLRKSYYTDAGAVDVLRGITLSVTQGEFVAVMGPSGSGKSTFMNIIGAMDKPTSGLCEVNGTTAHNLSNKALARFRNEHLGFVFQNFNLLSRYTLLANVALPLVYAGVPGPQRNERAQAMLEKVGLPDAGHRLPSQISGGQQQRVAIARALVNNPKLLLADEPTGNLDTLTSESIMELFRQLNQEGITVVLVTHEPDIARHAHRLVRFRDGNVVFDGSVAEGLQEAGSA